jgi:hypothetical protein
MTRMRQRWMRILRSSALQQHARADEQEVHDIRSVARLAPAELHGQQQVCGRGDVCAAGDQRLSRQLPEAPHVRTRARVHVHRIDLLPG